MTCALALASSACFGTGGPPTDLKELQGRDGTRYLLLDRGPYRAFYDSWGRLLRIEYDSNGDGRPDQIAHHEGRKRPRLIEIDEDFDGSTDRFESYDDTGRLIRIGATRRKGLPDVWLSLDELGNPVRREYDDDGDGRAERAEVLDSGRVSRIEIDSDRDGRFDRWQNLSDGRPVSEELDTDGDGRPDRRLRYDAAGRLTGVERLP